MVFGDNNKNWYWVANTQTVCYYVEFGGVMGEYCIYIYIIKCAEQKLRY